MEPLDHDRLVARSSEVSPAGYLTIISIVQGIAVGMLAGNLFSATQKGPDPEPLTWLQAAAVLSLLAFVFHFYVTTSPFLRWPPSFLDSLLPFVVGGCEIPPTYHLGTTGPWCYSIAALCVVAAGGLVSTGISSTKELFDKDLAHAHFRRVLVQVGLLALVAGAVVVSCALSAQHVHGDQDFEGIAAAGAVILAIAAMSILMERALCNIYGEYEISRPFFL